ncbi:WXG100 family type VII secretion target [Nocardioides sp.]|uniref:WXG100 family type VII secretion target n=1 Tax=Nocardioides sp. TaxID=35761 RepID=UPI003511BFBD
MYGDTTVIRRLAGRMDERAGELRRTATRLGAAAEGAHWWSVSAEAMRARVEERAAVLERLAADYEEAAGALRHHADEVDEVKALIAHIERAVGNLVEGAIDRLRAAGHTIVEGVKDGVKAVGRLVGIGDDEPDPHDVRLAGFTPPPPGDRAWLEAPDQLGVRV